MKLGKWVDWVGMHPKTSLLVIFGLVALLLIALTSC